MLSRTAIPLLVLALGLTTLNGCSPNEKSEKVLEEEKLNNKVIYGDDDRKDFYEVADLALKKASESTVALIKSEDLKATSGGKVQIVSQSYKSAYNLCSSEPFVAQEIAAFCSGSLVGKDLVITAGHCIKNANDCAQTKFAFGYNLKAAGELPKEVLSEDVYGCKQIVKQELVNGSGMDYAVIKLDREVVKQKPLKIKRSGVLSVNSPVTVMGHPSGLPLKIASGGSIRSVNSIFYVTNLDTYGGNSGSAVFDTQTLEVVGILVRGEEDYVSQGSCNVSNRCGDGACRGEDVTRIDALANLIPELDGEVDVDPIPPVEVVFEAKPNVAIPDRTPAGIESSIEITELPQGRKVLVAVDIAHTYVGDLILTLVDSNGKSYVLRKNKGGRQINLAGVYGDTLVSETDLSSLSQLQTLGKIKLKVADTVARDTGVLKSWKVIYR